MIIAQLSIVPLGESTSVSRHVKIVLRTLRAEKDLKVYPNAMATVLEAPDLPTLFSAVQKAHNAVLANGAQRVITQLKIDDRRDKNATVESKLKSIA